MDWVAYKHGIFFLSLTILETGKSRIQEARKFNVWWEPISWFIESSLFVVSSYGRREKWSLWDLFAVCSLSHVLLLVTPWTVAHQVPVYNNGFPSSTKKYNNFLLPCQWIGDYLLFIIFCLKLFCLPWTLSIFWLRIRWHLKMLISDSSLSLIELSYTSIKHWALAAQK